MRKTKGKVFGAMLLSLLMVVGALVANPSRLQANFEGNEAYWSEVCSQYITDPSLKNQCLQYQAYLTNKKNTSASNASNIQSKIDGMQGNMNKLIALSKEYSAQIAQLDSEIVAIDASILEMTKSIVIVEENITVKEENIKVRSEQIKERMLQIQPKVSTNEYVDFIMGAEDLVDFIQRTKSVQAFTDHDTEMIDALNAEMKALEEDKVELKRIQKTLELQKTEISSKKQEQEALKVGNDTILASYHKEEANLIAQRNANNSAANTAESAMPSLNFGNGGSGGGTPPPASGGFASPVPGAYRSAGTWSYPGGGLHLGLDLAAPIGTPIYAPANAIVLYANNPVGTNSGFLGNWSGAPSGGGNSIFLLMEVQGTVYAMQFLHCSQSMPVLGKSTVSQGELIGYVGNSGNTSGPHTHIEMLRIKMSVQQAVSQWNSSKDWQFGTGWTVPGGSSQYADKLQPEAYVPY